MSFNLPKSQKSKRKQRLENILAFINNSVIPSENNKIKNYTIFFFVKLYDDKINFHLNEDTLTQKRLSEDRYSPLGDFYNLYKRNAEIEASFKVSLALDPVITNIWNSNRLVSNINEIATPEQPWKQQKTNHMFQLYLPMGVTEVYNGNHSANSGILKDEGELNFNVTGEPNDLDGKIYDMSHLYADYYYDGNQYRSYIDKSFHMPGSFESGCVFEIGRLIHNNNISFINVINFRNSIGK